MDDTKLGAVAHSPESHAAIKRELNRLERWADKKLMEFSEEKCKVLQLWGEEAQAPVCPESRWAGKQLCREDPGVQLGVHQDHL